MYEKRLLYIEAKESLRHKGYKEVRIIRQSHRNDNFTPDGGRFSSSNGFHLYSDGEPEYRTRELFVRGSSTERDGHVVYVPEEDFFDLAQAIKEYNNGKAPGDFINFK